MFVTRKKYDADMAYVNDQLDNVRYGLDMTLDKYIDLFNKHNRLMEYLGLIELEKTGIEIKQKDEKEGIKTPPFIMV